MEEHRVNNQFEVLTPSGFKPFLGMRKVKKDSSIEITTDKGSLTCSKLHPMKLDDGSWISSELLAEGDILLYNQEEKAKVESVKLVQEPIELFDLLEVEGHEYFTNGLVSHNCDFVGSVHTLISPRKLKTLSFINPVWTNDEGLKMYEKPVPNKVYILVVDTCRGTGNDYHAFSVIDITEAPYRVVATFRNNILPPVMYPTAIISTARMYNNAFVLVELNDIGAQVSDIIHNDFEYEGLIVSSVKGRKGQVVDGGFSSQNLQRGVKTTEPVKRLGCSTLKGLIEQSKLIVEDYETVGEMFTFVASKGSFEAEPGHHDDLVMTLVLFAWLTTQPYFKDLTGGNIAMDMYSKEIKELEDDMFFGFIDNGIHDPEDHSGGGWTPA